MRSQHFRMFPANLVFLQFWQNKIEGIYSYLDSRAIFNPQKLILADF